MQAMVWTKFGPPDVLQLKEVAKLAPKDRAASEYAEECNFLKG